LGFNPNPTHVLNIPSFVSAYSHTHTHPDVWLFRASSSSQ
jgi:hypothetical protein